MASKKALSAYELIAKLEKKAAKKIAPLTVYRHLDFLIRVGLVHRLESIQSYVACDHPERNHEGQYLLCSQCGQVDEVESSKVEQLLNQIADNRGFKPINAVIEIAGLCVNCAEQGSK